jgi:hypothetical protein
MLGAIIKLHGSIWDYLLQLDFVNYSWKQLSLFLEASKFIRSVIVYQESINIFVPESNMKILISGYMSIGDFSGIGFYTHGDDLAIVYNGDSYLVNNLNYNYSSVDIPDVTSDTLIRDVYIKGKNLLYCMHTKVSIKEND